MTRPPTQAGLTQNLISLRVGAAQAQCCVRTLRQEIARGRLRAYRVGRKILIDIDDFTAYLRSREIHGGEGRLL